MGLPYLLGDKDPRDPAKGWDKTWAFLKELNTCIEYYPTGTGAMMKELGEGSRDMTVTMTGWDLNPRILGIVPKDFKVTPFDNMTWVNDAHYMAIPKGLSSEKLAVVLDLMAFLLKPEQQALTYDKGYFYPGPSVKNVPLSMAPKGYFYPGPSVKNVPLSMAPKESQDALKEFGRPEYDTWLTQYPHVPTLEAKAVVEAFRRWDAEVGAQKTK
jgi:putative spermidine/putrescine transport system substrate-binding protein